MVTETSKIALQFGLLKINYSLFPPNDGIQIKFIFVLFITKFKTVIALRTDPKNRTSHGRPPARLRQTLTFVLKIREEKRPKTE